MAHELYLLILRRTLSCQVIHSLVEAPVLRAHLFDRIPLASVSLIDERGITLVARRLIALLSWLVLLGQNLLQNVFPEHFMVVLVKVFHVGDANSHHFHQVLHAFLEFVHLLLLLLRVGLGVGF